MPEFTDSPPTNHKSYYPSGKLYIEEWRYNGVRCNRYHNENFYFHRVYDHDGELIKRFSYDRDNIHNLFNYIKSKYTSSYSIDYYLNGNPRTIDLDDEQNGISNSINYRWNEHGIPIYIRYEYNGQDHRINYPCNVMWYDNGQIDEVLYKKKNALYNVNGPAMVGFHPNGVFKVIKYHKYARVRCHFMWNKKGVPTVNLNS